MQMESTVKLTLRDIQRAHERAYRYTCADPVGCPYSILVAGEKSRVPALASVLIQDWSAPSGRPMHARPG